MVVIGGFNAFALNYKKDRDRRDYLEKVAPYDLHFYESRFGKSPHRSLEVNDIKNANISFDKISGTSDYGRPIKVADETYIKDMSAESQTC